MKLTDLEKASHALSTCYRTGTKLSKKEHFHTYMEVRLPATFAAACAVLKEVQARFEISSLLDLGAGPGTFSLAAKKFFPTLEQITCIEREKAFIDLTLVSDAAWIRADLEACKKFEIHDLVVFSYSLNEVGPEMRQHLVQKAWEGAQKALVIIEPGTPKGSAIVQEARSLLINCGGHSIAPCPHNNCCPLNNMSSSHSKEPMRQITEGANKISESKREIHVTKPSWCHFSVRLERSRLHRQMKNGTLAYEDEKFSYVIMAKEKSPHADARLISHPRKRPGHIYAQLCTQDGIHDCVITKGSIYNYKQISKAKWGDAITT